MTKATLPRKGRAIPLGQPLSGESSDVAEIVLARSGWSHMVRGSTFRDFRQGLGVRYEISIRATGSGFRVWSTVEGHVFPNDPCQGQTFERYSNVSRDMLTRKIERCVLDAWAEIERRSHVALLNAAAEYAKSMPWFVEAVETQEALWGQSDYQSMTIEQARRWRAWIDEFISGKLALPPSRQLGPERTAFQLHHGGLVLFEGAKNQFYIYPEQDTSNDVYMGNLVNAYSDSGDRAEALENLSLDFITNSGDFWAAYFGA